MTLRLLFHPLSSFCQKVLIALYENATPFTPELIDLGNPDSRAALARWWPLARFPVLRDEARDRTVPESSVIIDYLDLHAPGPTRFVPADPEQAWPVRLWDRFYDGYVQQAMQKVVSDRLRPADGRDPLGVAQARAQLRTAYDLIEREMADRRWAAGAAFGLADCAAGPALFYADRVEPLGDGHPAAARYLARLKARPSYARALAEAEPWLGLFPEG
ncbi:MAG: glutathione S-transferase family protein [Dongiaceae bacterium]